MNHWKAFLGWMFLGGALSTILTISLTPADAQAAPFASPIPSTPTLNQPYVTFQNSRTIHRILHFGNDVPVYLVLLFLILLLILAAFYLSSHPKH